MLPEFLPPQLITAPDGVRIATYSAGDSNAPVIHAVHGFASSAILNWQTAGWVRVLVRAGFRVVAHDQRGHGASDSSTDPAFYSMDALVNDARAVQDSLAIRPHLYLGYSLGARVGWRLGLEDPARSEAIALGGMPLGNSLRGFDATAAREVLAGTREHADRLTDAYLSMARAATGNSPEALVALAEGLRSSAAVTAAPWPDRLHLLAVGDADPLLADNRELAEVTGAELVVLPGRNHINAVTSRPFKDAILALLGAAGSP
ncbi:MAG: alpha/beta fold hydrolase [Mycetocola sp.]